MERRLTEAELESLESTAHLLKHLLLKKDAKGHEYWRGMLELDKIGKFILDNNIKESEVENILQLDLLKEFIGEFFEKIMTETEKSKNENDK